jgi:hypothetical protein
MVGKEDCATYCARVPLSRRRLGVAGMFNTGTNLLDTHLQANIELPQKSVWQVPWGKHRMANAKHVHTAENMQNVVQDDVLPVVIIRDPFMWLQSMCGHPYAAMWRRGRHHCPNLLPNLEDQVQFPDHAGQHPQLPFAVKVKFDQETQQSFDSLVHLWSEWYAQYLHVDYPILMSTCCGSRSGRLVQLLSLVC